MWHKFINFMLAVSGEEAKTGVIGRVYMPGSNWQRREAVCPTAQSAPREGDVYQV